MRMSENRDLLTVRELLLHERKSLEKGARDRLEGHREIKALQQEIEKKIKNGNIPRIADTIAGYLEEMLDIDLRDVLSNSWKKYSTIKKALIESKKDPEKTSFLALAKHTIVSKHHPYIEVDLNDEAVRKIVFDITLKLMLEGFVLEIRDGAIVAAETGDCRASGKISFEDIVLLEKKSEKIGLPGKIVWNEE